MSATDPFSAPELDFKALFQHMPGPYIVIKADDPTFTIVAENDEHGRMSLSDPKTSIGKPVFEIFPDTSDTYKKTGISELAESFRNVIRTAKPDTMERVRYDVAGSDGKFEERYWQATHYPILDKTGKVAYIYQVTRDITHEVIAERKLKQTEDQLDEALSIGGVGSWVWDIANDRVIANSNLAQFFGVSPVQASTGLPIQTFIDSMHEEDRLRIAAAIKKALRQKSSFEEEYRTVAPDGTTHWVLARGRIETDAKGRPQSFPGVIVDITARKEAEAKYSRQLDLTNTITQSLGEGVCALDKAGNITFINAAAQRMLGWTHQEVLGQSLHKLIHFQDADGTPIPETKCPVLNGLKTGRTVRRDADTFTRKDGTMFTVSFTAVPLKQGGKVVGMVESFNDVSERQQNELNLQFLASASTTLASSLDYKKTLRSIAELVVPRIADWCAIDLLNQGKVQQVVITHKDPTKLAWARAERAKRPLDLSRPRGAPHVIQTGKPEYYPVITEELLTTSATSKADLRRLHKLDFQSVMIIPLKQQHETIGAISFVSSTKGRHFSKADYAMAQELGNRTSLAITNASLYQTARNELAERERLEEALRQVNEDLEHRVSTRTAELQTSNTKLERSNQELQDFAYVASHDLQEPLRKIQAFSNLLGSEYADILGEGRDYLERMQNAAGRMSTLIEDLLSFSRVTTKARPFEPVDLQVIATEVLEDLETRIAETGGRVRLKHLPTIMADPMQMRQLLQNLIGNALKFSRQGVPPMVDVSATTKKKGGKIQSYALRVSDNGIGFEEKYLDRIFAVFQRLHGRDQYQGTGIGLAICRKIAERHGGTITAKSTPGHGATFTVTLPSNTKGVVHL